MVDPKEDPTGERTFLHDISNQLIIAQGMGSFVLANMEKTADPESKELKRMQKSIKALNKIVDLVKERREIVRSRPIAE